MLKKQKRYTLVHLSIIFGVILLDQITKAYIVQHVPFDPFIYPQPVFTWGGDFFHIIHTRNIGALFSLGSRWPKWINTLFLKVTPMIILSYLTLLLVSPQVIYKRIPQKILLPLSQLQAIALSFAVGGGFGNMIDRIFRPEGVVDFIDIKFYGIFGLERWPTFNVADMSVVLFLILFILGELPFSKKEF